MKLNKKTITAGNKLVAAFMGWKLMNINWDDDSLPVKLVWNDGKCFINMGLKFNTSWDWLMPVLKKVRDTPVFVNKAKPYISEIDHAVNSVDIFYLYGAIVDFIKWYEREGREQIRKDDERIANM